MGAGSLARSAALAAVLATVAIVAKAGSADYELAGPWTAV